jgi:TetR/AcrR family transcriptional regulator
MNSPGPPPDAADDLDTRERILDAARSAFRDRGTSGARMQAIADAAGVNKALLHYYFRDKETLASGVFTRELQHLIQPVLKVLGSELSLEGKVRQAVELYFTTLSAFPGLPAYVLAEIHYHPDRLQDFLETVADGDPRGRVLNVFSTLERQIDEAVAKGRMRPITPQAFVVNLVSLCVFPFAAGPLLDVLLGGEHALRELMEERRRTLPDFFLKGLEP